MPVENLIIAVRQHATGPLVVTSAEAAMDPDRTQISSEPMAHSRSTIANSIPALANVRATEEAELATLYIPFKRVFPEVPKCYVGLVGSKYALTFIRVPYLERKLHVAMVLAVGISDFVAIPVDPKDLPVDFRLMLAQRTIGLPQPDAAVDQPGRRTDAEQEVVALVVAEFRQYIDFPDDDVLWDKVFLKTNKKEMLYLNTVGSRADAPPTHDPTISNLYFAVGTKDNPITIATVECSVYGGLQAAQALWRHMPQSRHGTVKPITPILPETYDPGLLWAWKIMLAPWAVAAKCWSDAQQIATDIIHPPKPEAEHAPSHPANPETGLADLLAPFSVPIDTLLQTAMASVTASFAFWGECAKLCATTLPVARPARRRRR